MTQEPFILLVTIPDLPYDNNLNCKESNKFTDCSIRVVTLLTDIHLWLVQNLQFSPHDLVPYWTPDSFWQQDPYNINRSTSFSINYNTHMCHMHTHIHTHTCTLPVYKVLSLQVFCSMSYIKCYLNQLFYCKQWGPLYSHTHITV